LRQKDSPKERSQRAIELLGSAIDVKIHELTESNRQLKRKIFDLITIFELSRNLNAVLDYETLVDSFLLTSLGQVGASSAALYLPQESRAAAFTLAIAKGLPHEEEALADVPIDGPLATYVLTLGKPIGVTDLSERFSDLTESAFLSTFSGGLIIPLIMKAELRGLLAVGHKVSGARFSPDDIEFLTILANQFAVALDNARLYESEKNALRELRKAQKQLVLTERQAAIGELSAKIAHEINNPLSIVSNYLLLSQRDMENPDSAREHLDVARQELGRIARIVRQLLDFQRPHKIETAPVDIPKLVEYVLTLVEWQLTEHQIKISLDAPPDLPCVIGSQEMLKQVFLNLVINARDAMPGGGTLKIQMSADDSEVRIRLADTGPGIPREHLSRIFEPFFTTKEGSAGTGLGLAVCYGIVRDHGGRITAENSVDGGALFEITLPAQADREAIDG